MIMIVDPEKNQARGQLSYLPSTTTTVGSLGYTVYNEKYYSWTSDFLCRDIVIM